MSAPVIQIVDLAKHYEGVDDASTVHALRDVTFDVEPGEMLALTGSSGSGKSTLMNILGCLDRPTSGRYVLNGTDVASMSAFELASVRNLEIGFVFQSFNLMPRATVLENVMHPLVYRGVRKPQRRERAREALAKLGLASREHHRPNQLSGGQRQRVAIARALVGEPKLLLADEPTGNLDSQTTQEVLGLLTEINEAGQTIIVVTHEEDVAARCRRRLKLSDGSLVEDATT